jgi:hypothetical protein
MLPVGHPVAPDTGPNPSADPCRGPAVVLLEMLPPVAAIAYVWVVWSGRFWWWFEEPGGWTLVLWPLPPIAVAATPAIVMTERLLGVVGLTVPVAAIIGVWLAIAGILTVRPPRWLFPAWVRERLVALPRRAAAPSADAAPALRVAYPLPFGEVGPRWSRRVDAQPGFVRTVDGTLRFEPTAAANPATPAALTYTVEPADDPADGAVERWPLDDGHEVRAYPQATARAASTRWSAPLGEVRIVRPRRRGPRWLRSRRLVPVTIEARGASPLRLMVADVSRLTAPLQLASNDA